MNSNIYEQLQKLYNDTGYPPGTLQEDLAYYLRVGYVFAAPEYFIMGCEISGGYYIHAAVGVGALEKFLQHMPKFLPYVGWERRGSGKIKWYSTTRLTNKILRKAHNEKSESTSGICPSSSK